MEINVLNHEKTLLEFEIGGVDSTMPEMLTNRLSENDAVEFVSYKLSHPLVGKPRIILRTKSKDALDLAIGMLEEMRGEVSDLKKALKKSK